MGLIKVHERLKVRWEENAGNTGTSIQAARPTYKEGNPLKKGMSDNDPPMEGVSERMERVEGRVQEEKIKIGVIFQTF